MTQTVREMRNLGPIMARRLAETGIETADDLRRLGAVEAYRRLRFHFGRVSLTALYAMDAALHDRDWREVPEARKIDLKRMVAEG
jgi:DNA transformation protein